MVAIAVNAGEAPELEAFLAQRIHDFNMAATGYYDAEDFSASHHSESGVIEGGISGYIWGGCCFVSYLWVAGPCRGKGLGRDLMTAVERHARDRRCRLVLLSSHSFQAPAFYARLGYTRVGCVDDYPVGHADIFYSKRLDADTA